MSAQPGTAKAKLIDVSKTTGLSAFSLSQPIVRIGRASINDFLIKEKTISGKHAAIEQRQDGYFLIDLKSTNGSRINGKLIDPNVPYKLNDGDVIYFDKYPFVFQIEMIAPEQPARIYEHTMDLEATPLSMEAPAKAAAPPAPRPAFTSTIDIESVPAKVNGEITKVPKPAPDNGEPVKIGNYDVIKLLGKGGFGSVWKATDPKGLAVAVKLLNPDALQNEKAVRKFFHEAIILSRLDHPNICRFIDFFPYNQNFAIVMDFVQGIDMKKRLRQRAGPFPLETACRIAEQTLDAFHYAHQQSVLHRDIKPENITLDETGEVKIMDFGIAKLSSAETQHTSATMISPAYTAPERFDIKKEVTHRSDIYSLGIFFYEMFTGRHPFKAASPVEMITAHLRTVPAPPHEIAPVPVEISRAILKSLEKRPEDRFENFAAFKTAMLGESAGEPADAAAPQAAITFAGEYYSCGAALLEMYLNAVRQHQDGARKFTLLQNGTQLELIIEPAGGGPIRINKDLDKIIAEKSEE
ncbi:MAG: protein kinase [Thermodesulfobacteriota bacterium]